MAGKLKKENGFKLPEDEDLFVRQAQDDLEAFGPLFDYYAPRVYRYVLHRLGNVRNAEDVTSQIFTDALQSLDRYRPKTDASFGGWLFTIARRRCADHFRLSKPLPLYDFGLKDKGAGLLERVISREELDHLKEIMKTLKEKERELLRLRFAADMTYQQIGDIVGKSEGAAKMSLRRLIKRIRSGWEEDDGRFK